MFSLSHGIPLDVSTLETNENKSPVCPCVSRFFFGVTQIIQIRNWEPPIFRIQHIALWLFDNGTWPCIVDLLVPI